MTPQEMANRIKREFLEYAKNETDAKNCALITLKEILNCGIMLYPNKKYWEQAREEIIKQQQH